MTAQGSMIRITIVDRDLSISFGAGGYMAKMVVAASSRNPSDLDALLGYLAAYDAVSVEAIRHGLNHFDEFCLRDDPDACQRWLDEGGAADGRPFRLIDQGLREASLTQLQLGLVIVNLVERRIVQVANRYGTVLRKDHGRLRREGKPISQLYGYSLPDDWSLVP
jgi:hypothetical protein